MEAQVGEDGLPAGVSATIPALADEQSSSEAAAAAFKKASASSKEVAKPSHMATLDDLAKMESSIMANFEKMFTKLMGSGVGSNPPLEQPVIPIAPTAETTLVDASAVAPPHAGF